MKRIRIACVGDYSVSNYGDRIYPRVIRDLAADIGLEADFALFGLVKGTAAYGMPVESIDRISHCKPNLVLVGGGDLIRCDWSVVAHDHLNIPIERRQRLISRIRGRLFQMGRRRTCPGPWLPTGSWCEGVPTVLISVGVHPLHETPGVREAVGGLAAAWVRTFPGADYLRHQGMANERLEVAPDAVFAMASLRDPEALRAEGVALLDRLGIQREPMVVHAASFHGWTPKRLMAQLTKLGNVPRVGMVLGRYAGEESLMRAACEPLGIPVLTGLSESETTSLLAAAGSVVSTSMHAAIVAASVGTPVVATATGKTSTAFACCPSPPPVHAVPHEEIAAIAASVHGMRHPGLAPTNRLAVLEAFRSVLRHAGF